MKECVNKIMSQKDNKGMLVRVSPEVYKWLKQQAKEKKTSMGDIMDQWVYAMQPQKGGKA
jgi:predicted HicB family RNase H-like nuclease